jgi:hypothetical protein
MQHLYAQSQVGTGSSIKRSFSCRTCDKARDLTDLGISWRLYGDLGAIYGDLMWHNGIQLFNSDLMGFNWFNCLLSLIVV